MTRARAQPLHWDGPGRALDVHYQCLLEGLGGCWASCLTSAFNDCGTKVTKEVDASESNEKAMYTSGRVGRQGRQIALMQP